MTGSCVCRTIADPVELAAVVPEWWELWWQSPVATPFQAPAWLMPWRTNFAPGELCVVAVRLDGRLVGLAPFYCEHCRRGRRALPMGFPVTDYHDVLIAPRLEEPVLAALGSHLADAEICDEVEFTELPPHAYALRMAARSATLRTRVMPARALLSFCRRRLPNCNGHFRLGSAVRCAPPITAPNGVARSRS